MSLRTVGTFSIRAEAPEATPPRQALGRAAVGGVAWQGASYLLGKVSVLVTTIMLARILTPRDFGIVALALVFIAYADVVTDLGVAQALVFLPADRRNNDAALTISLLVSMGLVALAMPIAPLAARFFGRPDVTTLFRVMSLSLLLGAVGQVPDALLRRDLRFRRRFVPTLARSIGQGVVSIGLALAGLGPWSIVIGYLAGDAIYSGAAWILVGYRPGPRFWRASALVLRPLLGYGVPAAAHALLVSLIFDVDYLIVGKLLGPVQLGYYTIGFRIPELVIINVFYVLSAVAFPVFSRTRHEPQRLRRAYLVSLRLQTTYGVGAGVAMAMIAPMLVHALLGARWAASIVPLEALALYAAFRSVGNSATDLYKGIGRPGLAMWLSLVRLVAVVPALWFAARFSIEWVSWTQALLALVLALLMQGVATRLLGIRWTVFARAMMPAVSVGFGAAVGAGLVRALVPGSELLRLILAVGAGAAGALAMVWWIDRSFVRETLGLVRRRPESQPESW